MHFADAIVYYRSRGSTTAVSGGKQESPAGLSLVVARRVTIIGALCHLWACLERHAIISRRIYTAARLMVFRGSSSDYSRERDADKNHESNENVGRRSPMPGPRLKIIYPFSYMWIKSARSFVSFSLLSASFSPANVGGDDPRIPGVAWVWTAYERARAYSGGTDPDVRYPTVVAGMEWKGKEPCCTYCCLSACHRHDYVSCLANPFSASHGTGAHGAVVTADSLSASGARTRAGDERVCNVAAEDELRRGRRIKRGDGRTGECKEQYRAMLKERRKKKERSH